MENFHEYQNQKSMVTLDVYAQDSFSSQICHEQRTEDTKSWREPPSGDKLLDMRLNSIFKRRDSGSLCVEIDAANSYKED